MTVVLQQMAEIFNSAQKTTASHEKCLAELKALYSQAKYENFYDSFIMMLGGLLQAEFKSTNPFHERVKQFCASFSTSLQPLSNPDESIIEPEFLTDVIYFLLEAQCNAVDAVRYHSCDMINKIMDKLIGADLSLELCDYILECMLERLDDKVAGVRIQAVAALHRLQDPSNNEDPIITEYINHMLHDRSNKVRSACVENIVLRRCVVPHLLKKLRDIDLNVRLAAFRKAAKHPNHFTILERQTIIKTGFSDTSSTITEFIEGTLVVSWLEHYNGDYIKLLNMLRMDAEATDIIQTSVIVDNVLKSLFKIRPHTELIEVLKFNENHVLPLEDLNWETIVYWYYLVSYLRKNNDYESVLVDVLPELIYFCEYISEYCKMMSSSEDVDYLEYQYVLKNMFLILTDYDFTDVAVRNQFIQFIGRTLKETKLDEDTMKTLLDALKSPVPNVNNRITIVSEVVSDLLTPPEVVNNVEQELREQLKDLKHKLRELEISQEKVVKERDFMTAKKYQEEIDQNKTMLEDISSMLSKCSEAEPVPVKTDPNVLAKCLDIVTGLLSDENVKKACGTLNSLKINLIQSCLSHEEEEIQFKALKCYNLFCLIDRKTAEIGIHVLAAQILAYHAQKPCDIQVLLSAIGGVADMLLLYGCSLITSPDDPGELDNEEELCVLKGGTSLTSIVQGLVDMMDDELPEIREQAVRALCNLISSGRVYSSHLLSRMIIKWCIPIEDDNEDDSRIRQRIGDMLEQLPLIQDTSNQMQEAVLLTLDTLLKAPKKSLLYDVNLDNIIKFLLQLCKSYETKDVNIHYNLAIDICHKIKSKPSNKFNEVFGKILFLLDLPTDVESLNKLIDIYDDLRDDVKQKGLSNIIVKFLAQLNSTKVQNSVSVEEEYGTEE